MLIPSMLRPYPNAFPIVVVLFLVLMPLTGWTQQTESPIPEEAPVVLFRNVRIFTGNSSTLSVPSSVLVRGNVIARISSGSTGIALEPGWTVVEGNGNTLMPGLIDAHWHSMFVALPMTTTLAADPGFVSIAAGQQAARTLMRGFTTVRDMGGPAFGLKLAIDRGVIEGPRIYPSGAHISQTSGHGDFRFPFEIPRDDSTPLSRLELLGGTAIADGVDEVLRRTREQLMLGASQIKLMAGGGVSSLYDPLDVTQYSEDELRAAVGAAEDWGTYVTVHAYTTRAVTRAIAAGVRSIEHGQLVDEDTAKLIAEKGIWWSFQLFLADEDANVKEDPRQRMKQMQVTVGTERAIELIKNYNIKVAWGTDILFSAAQAERQGAQLAKLARYFPPAQVLKIATHDNGELLALSGKRSPYPGKLGVVEESALADLLLVKGNPLEDIQLIANPDANFLVIMKDGKIFKNILSGEAR